MSGKRADKAKNKKADRGNAGAEDDPSKTTDDYQCCGNVEIDFPRLCALLGMNDIPAVKNSKSKINAMTLWRKPCLCAELESEDPCSVKSIKIFGWKVDELIAQVLNKMLPSLSKLQSLQLWQARLSDRMIISLKNTVCVCANLRSVILEGNPLPEQSYHLLLSEDSVLAQLSLRHNQMGDEGARLIGSALSTPTSANKNLMSLNLAFNSIGDAGAAYIAQGLRLNRALLLLSLSNNRIGDTGAAHLAKTLGEFALTHEEIIARRKLLLEKDQTASMTLGSVSLQDTPKKDEKPAANPAGGTGKKEDPKTNKKYTDMPCAASLPCHHQTGLVEIESPLLDPAVQHRDGQVILPGNTALAYLNLSGNRITKQLLPLLLTILQTQPEGQGLRRLCLQVCYSQHTHVSCVYGRVGHTHTNTHTQNMNPNCVIRVQAI
uniref:Leucine rich repeat containing 71 n=1 Tax=Myripristis murdjan TaxID=586833 RepID=A0A668A8H2_9TELE